MTSRTSFDETARYWAHIYAGAPSKEDSGAGAGAQGSTTPATRTGTPRDEIAMAGLERAHVEQFEGLGFDRAKVVSMLIINHVRSRIG